MHLALDWAVTILYRMLILCFQTLEANDDEDAEVHGRFVNWYIIMLWYRTESNYIRQLMTDNGHRVPTQPPTYIHP